ncbi:ATP-binding protein [Chryseobacterium carnipullorum]|uniref:ATP-binding protein n=1 Tax=Chryseobacterium carnipullorum TaxID=1124835 RepID=UPI000F4F3F86|nr:ATP-binding protein [Chryseobacterium carnipullorum]AZA64437.1 ATP-binding protein [Chryseobacterium carnipullorum]
MQDFLKTNKRALSFTKVYSELPELNKDAFGKLHKASGLNLTEFTDFVRLLDFNDCGSNSRQLLKLELINSISKNSIKSKGQFNSLFQLVWSKMMPESEDSRTIGVIDVIASFGFSAIENLFPVSQNFEKNLFTVEREQLKDIIAVIDTNGSYHPICLHGGAGIGKSTIVNQIKNSVPDYCKSILFDSYGAGKYQNPEDKRHLHKNAFVQLANELAKSLGTEFLLLQNESDDVYLNEFKRRIREGVGILRSRNTKAYLLLIIDAADNSVTAAESFGERSFVQDLVNMEIPEGCHVVVTSRTYRKDSLKLPVKKHLDYELRPFSLEETTEFAKINFKNITKREILEFHQFTHGIPRVQFYSMSLQKQGIKQVINYLKPNGKVVENLILDKIEDAIVKLGENNRSLVDDFFKLLIMLPRPVPIDYIAEIMNVKVAFLQDLAADIWNGLVLENNHFYFRDEDFENYIRQAYASSLEEHQNIANLFLLNSDKDEYASTNLGAILYSSGLKTELIDIVLDRKFLDFPKDPIRNREVYINRTKLALNASVENEHDINYFKLLFIAAQESKTDRGLTNLLINFPDLVLRFGDQNSLARLQMKTEERTWAGSFHLKLAGINSRKPENREITIKHLKTATEWLIWRKTKSGEDLRHFPVSSLDIAFEAEAFLKLYGIEKMLERLTRWSPIESKISAAKHLIENIVSYSSESEIAEWLKYNKFRIDEKIFISCKLFQYNLPINFDLPQLTKDLSRVLSLRKKNFSKVFCEFVVEFCGILSYYKVDSGVIIDYLMRIDSKQLNRVPFFNDDRFDDESRSIEIFLKKDCLLLSLQNVDKILEDYYPSNFRNLDKIEDYDQRKIVERDKKEFVTFFKYAVPIYQLHSDFLTKRFEVSELIDLFRKICSDIQSDYDFKHQFGYWANSRFVFLAVKLAKTCIHFDDEGVLMQLIIDSFDKQTDQLKLRFEILKTIILRKKYLKFSFKLLHQAKQIIQESHVSANESTENYLQCLLLSSKINDTLSKDFFDKAIKSVSEIDIEAFAQIRCIYELSQIGIVNENSKLAYDFARFIEYCDIKLGIYEKKGFPYAEGLLGIGNIDKSSMFPTLCRWHHRNVIKLGGPIITLLKKAMEIGYIDHITAAALIPLKTNYSWRSLEDLYKMIIAKIDITGKTEIKNKFVKSEFRDLRMQKDKHYSKEIYDQVKPGQFIDDNLLKEIKEYVDFLDSLETKPEDSKSKNIDNKQDHHNINLATLDFTSVKELERAIDHIIVNSESFNNRSIINSFFADIVEHCEVEDQVLFLNSVVEVSSDLLEYYTLENILEKAFEEWEFYPDIKNWKKNNFEKVLISRLHQFDYGSSLNIFSIKSIAKLFSIDDTSLEITIRKILPQKIDLLSDESIYSSFELVKNTLSKDKNEELLEWIIKRWISPIQPDIADGLWTEELRPSSDFNENIADMMRFILGHPDKRLRWRGIHSLRKMVNLGNTDIFEILLKKQNEKSCLPFQEKNYMFYWMSSKLYLWIALDRISKENPDKFLHLKDIFYQELLSNDLPHVLIRHYIKKCCLNLYTFDKSLFKDDELDSIQQVNNSKLEMLEEKRYARKQRNYARSDSDSWRFRFSSLDTLPYWYDKVGDPFNLSEYDVADVADKIIAEDWGYVGNPNEDDFIRNQLYNGDWHLTRNDHGSNPEVEDVSIYWQYHSMYCAANFLLENEPFVKNDHFDGREDWEDWLKSEANAFDNLWLSDLRDPLPLKKKYWKEGANKFDKIWRDQIQEDDFDSVVGFLDQTDSFFYVYGGITLYVGANQESVSIISNLVSSDKSDALLRALHTTKDSYDYYFPLAKSTSEDEDDDGAIGEKDFLLKGWIREFKSEYEGLDSQDELFNNNQKGSLVLDEGLQKRYDVTYDESYKMGYAKNSLISLFENWNEISNDEHRNRKYNTGVESSGSILKISKEFLVEFLKQEKKDLILRCIIDRQLEERHYRERDSDNRYQVKLYLIKANGTVKTLRGVNYKIG